MYTGLNWAVMMVGSGAGIDSEALEARKDFTSDSWRAEARA